ncbi:hypothetical protein DKK71_01955 [Snodgrassella alvi]|uniref:KAP family P-loop NTPase fold protein n=1 Tax=Snodgrassella alvi TaxID=1196083 RepID=UPI000D781BBE|nr:P-loop NTPase fold protein [Snodgrassella alvi]PXY98324.1 hypothetical protein DKK71_01955 [Snodgrassella alvi]
MGKLSLGKCQPIEIDADNPFKNDALGRKENIENLTQFITSFEQSIVLCIDGGWGQGKTTFIKMWQQYLKNQHIPTIYFNAWESDYTDDALIALIGEISLSIKKLKQLDKSKVDETFESIYKYAANFAKAVAPSAANLSIKAISGGLTNADELSKTLSALGESMVKEQIKKYEESRRTLSKFKEELSKLAQCYTGGDKQKPLVIFIDELDRCRPDFAIEVLEKAKHLFNVDNIIFVLATDKTQLSHSIRAVYGQGLDVNGYLRRFIDFDYLLPRSSIQPYIIRLIRKFSLEEYFLNKGKRLTNPKNFLVDIVNKYNVTLREQEVFFNIFNIVIRTDATIHLEHWSNIIMLIFLIILKLKSLNTYKNLGFGDTRGFYDTLKDIQSHFTPIDDGCNNYLELLEFLFLEIFGSFQQTPFQIEQVIEKYAYMFNFNESKKTRLILLEYEYGDPCINLQSVLGIKESIEISYSFKFN